MRDKNEWFLDQGQHSCGKFLKLESLDKHHFAPLYCLRIEPTSRLYPVVCNRSKGISTNKRRARRPQAHCFVPGTHKLAFQSKREVTEIHSDLPDLYEPER